MTYVTKQELLDASTDAQTLEYFVNSGLTSIPLRLGGTIPSIQRLIDTITLTLGYQVPVVFTTGLDVDAVNYTVDYNGVIYAPLPSEVPFTTTASFDPAQWYVVQKVDVGSWLPTPFEYGATADVATHLGAINDAIAANNGVHLPKGTTWTIDGPIVLAANGIVITGGGTITTTETSPPINLVELAAGGDFCTIENLKLIQSSTYSGNTLGNAINAVGVDGLTVRNCTVTKCAGSCVYLQTCRGTKIIGNLFHDPGGADNTSGADIVTWGLTKGLVIANNICVSVRSQNISIGGLAGDDGISIIGNYCDSLDANFDVVPLTSTPVEARHGILCHYSTSEPILNGNTMTISGNTIRHKWWSGIYCHGHASGVTISGNTIKNCGYAVQPGFACGINLSAGPDFINVIGNTIDNCTGSSNSDAAIYIGETGPNVLVSGNIIRNSLSHGILFTSSCEFVNCVNNVVTHVTASRHAIAVLIFATDIPGVISGNHITVTGLTVGIYILSQLGDDFDSLRMTIENNYIQSTAGSANGTGAAHCGIWIRNRVATIRNNTIEGFKTAIYSQLQMSATYARNVDNLVIQNNVLRDIGTTAYRFNGTSEGLVLIEGAVNYSVASPLGSSCLEGIRFADKVWVQVNGAVPTIGTYVAGDRAINISGTTTEPVEWHYNGSSWTASTIQFP